MTSNDSFRPSLRVIRESEAGALGLDWPTDFSG